MGGVSVKLIVITLMLKLITRILLSIISVGKYSMFKYLLFVVVQWRFNSSSVGFQLANRQAESTSGRINPTCVESPDQEPGFNLGYSSRVGQNSSSVGFS